MKQNQIRKFRKRTLVLAYQHDGPEPIVIRTLEGNMIAAPGDWIVQGVRGELYPCKSDIFAEIYEAIED